MERRYPSVQGVSSAPEFVPQSIAELTDRVRTLIADGRILDAVALLPGADDLVHTEDERLAFARMGAVVRSRAGDHVGAIESLRGVAATWLTRGHLMNAADINALEAFLNNMIGRSDNAIDHAATALVLVAECTEPDPVLSARCRTVLAWCFAISKRTTCRCASSRSHSICCSVLRNLMTSC